MMVGLVRGCVLFGWFVIATAAFGTEEPSKLIRIVSPAAGTTFKHGEPITAIVELSPPLTAYNTVRVGFIGQGQFDAKWSGGLTFTATLPTTVLAQGKLKMEPVVIDTSGWPTTGATVTVGVLPAAPLRAIEVEKQTYSEMPGGKPRQLFVYAELTDGSRFKISDAITGTTYSVSNPAVLDVSADGLVGIRAAGRSQVTVRNGDLTDVVNFVVEDPADPLPPVGLTSKFKFVRSDIRIDPRERYMHTQDLTIKNIGGTPLSGPLYVVLRNLPAGVKPWSRNLSRTKRIEPKGSPYLTVPLGGDGLTFAPGESATFTLQFLNSGSAAIDYTADLYATSAEP